MKRKNLLRAISVILALVMAVCSSAFTVAFAAQASEVNAEKVTNLFYHRYYGDKNVTIILCMSILGGYTQQGDSVDISVEEIGDGDNLTVYNHIDSEHLIIEPADESDSELDLFVKLNNIDETSLNCERSFLLTISADSFKTADGEGNPEIRKIVDLKALLTLLYMSTYIVDNGNEYEVVRLYEGESFFYDIECAVPKWREQSRVEIYGKEVPVSGEKRMGRKSVYIHMELNEFVTDSTKVICEATKVKRYFDNLEDVSLYFLVSGPIIITGILTLPFFPFTFLGLVYIGEGYQAIEAFVKALFAIYE